MLQNKLETKGTTGKRWKPIFSDWHLAWLTSMRVGQSITLLLLVLICSHPTEHTVISRPSNKTYQRCQVGPIYGPFWCEAVAPSLSVSKHWHGLWCILGICHTSNVAQKICLLHQSITNLFVLPLYHFVLARKDHFACENKFENHLHNFKALPTLNFL